jgi:hypothetical protein
MVTSARSRLAKSAPTVGFNLATVPTEHFKTTEPFVNRLEAQADAYAYTPADDVGEVDLNGRIGGTGLRLSTAAFADMCHYAGVPVKFIKSLAVMDPDQALDVMRTCIARVFHPRGGEKCLVVDSDTERVDGIVSVKTYKPVPSADIFRYVMQAGPDIQVTNGWTSGPNMRFTVQSKARFDVNPVVGDVVSVGMSVESAINGDMSVRIADYAERLSCTNGMVSRDNERRAAIPHKGEVDLAVQQAAVASVDRAAGMIPAMQRAATRILDVEEVLALRAFMRNSQVGGSKTLDIAATEQAQVEAKAEGRASDEVTLWGFVNGVTEQQHATKSIVSRQRIEALGLTMLHRFDAATASN